MKINLQNIELAKSALTDNVYIGLPEVDEKSWIAKKDITNQFLDAVIKRFNGYREIIEDKKEDKFFLIECKEVTEEKAKEFRREVKNGN